MVKRHKSKTGGAGNLVKVMQDRQKAKNPPPKRSFDEDSDDVSDDNDNYGNMSFEKKSKFDSDDEYDNEEVFNLGASDESDEDDDEEEKPKKGGKNHSYSDDVRIYVYVNLLCISIFMCMWSRI